MPETRQAVARTFDALAAARRRLSERDRLTVDTQIALAEIPAPTGAEAPRAERVRRALCHLGVAADIDRAGNVVGVRAGRADEAPVVMCAHVDTVFELSTPHRMARLGNLIVGPGIGDNARGLAGMLAIADALQATGIRTRRPIVFAATTGEEGAGDLRGARALFASSAASGAAAAIALDGAGDERVVTHALGCRRLRITLAGPGGHSWACYGVANALHAAAALVAELASWRPSTSPRSTLTVSRMAGGTVINAIPSDAWLETDARSASPQELDRLDREIRRAAQRAAEVENGRRRSGTPALTLAIETIGDRPGGAVEADAFITEAAFEATALIRRTPERAIASTDANIPLSLGIPAIAIGAGGIGGGTHTPLEWFENRDGTLGLARAMTVLVSLAGLA